MAKMNQLICTSRVKDFALEVAKDTRAQGFTRVSQGFMDAAEEALRRWIRGRVQEMPSVGKTLR